MNHPKTDRSSHPVGKVWKFDDVVNDHDAHSKNEQSVHDADAGLGRPAPGSEKHERENKGSQEIEADVSLLGDQSEKCGIEEEETESGADQLEHKPGGALEGPSFAHAFAYQSLLTEKVV